MAARAPASNLEPERPAVVVSAPYFALERTYIILAESVVTGQEGQGVMQRRYVLPQLHSLARGDSPHGPETVLPFVLVGPDDVNVEKIHELPLPQIALEPNGVFKGGKYVFDLDIGVVDGGAVCRHVSYPLRLVKADVKLHVTGVFEPPIVSVACKGYCVCG